MLANTRTASLPGIAHSDQYCHALLRLQLHKVATPVSSSKKRPTITDLLLATHLSVSRIDRRPSLTPDEDPFDSVYLVEVTGDAEPHRIPAALSGDEETEMFSWMADLNAALVAIQEAGGYGEIIGLW